jgi:hypothetical protein
MADFNLKLFKYLKRISRKAYTGVQVSGGNKNKQKLIKTMQQEFYINSKGRLLVGKYALLQKGVFTDSSYRVSKSLKRLEEITENSQKWVYVDSLSEVTRRKLTDKFSRLTGEYKKLLEDMKSLGLDCTQPAVQFTAESLHINEPFIRSAIETYINSHYTAYTYAYFDLGLHPESIKGYSKQCALVQWIYDFNKKIQESEADAKKYTITLRSFRMNLLTAVSNIELEVKLPLSETRFNKWFDLLLKQMNSGAKPEDIIQVKRKSNTNAGKVTDEHLKIAQYFYKNGTNMSVSAVYNKWLAYARKAGWWTDKEGNFTPPTEGRLYQLLRPLKNAHSLDKTDAITHHLTKLPTASRDLPEKINHVWVIDGTAHNENAEYSETVRQHVYAIKIADVSSLRLLGAAPLIGVKEPFYAVKEAILMGIRETGYKPAVIHCDRGPAWKELEAWCKDNEIKLYPSQAGNARAKIIESMFNMFDNDITRFLKGYSGQNRTALHINSRSSEKRESAGKRNARSASLVMDWVKTEGLQLWNERIIEKLEGKPCNKTPFELWNEKESYTPQLSYIQLCQLCGTLHEKKLTINGLDIQHKNKQYTYFPPIETSKEREAADKIFTYIPLDAKTSNRLKIYILEGGKEAPVYDHDGNYLGIWNLKKRTAYFAGNEEQNNNLNNITALQKQITETAKQINSEVDSYVERHPDFEYIEALGLEALTGKRRIQGRYDKSALLSEEIQAKAPKVVIPKKKTIKELVDPDTGEIYQIEITE